MPTDFLLIIFLEFSKELRELCGFIKIADTSKFTCCKRDFILDYTINLHKLVNITEPIYKKIDEFKTSMIFYDTSGIETFVTENNPKFSNCIINQLK